MDKDNIVIVGIDFLNNTLDVKLRKIGIKDRTNVAMSIEKELVKISIIQIGQSKFNAMDDDIKPFVKRVFPLCKLGIPSPWNSDKRLLDKEYYKSDFDLHE